MSQKPISHVQLTDTLGLTQMRDGFWLYDETRGMNLAMRAKTERDAFTEALTYYQGRLVGAEKAHSTLRARVDSFIEDVHTCDSSWED